MLVLHLIESVSPQNKEGKVYLVITHKWQHSNSSKVYVTFCVNYI